MIVDTGSANTVVLGSCCTNNDEATRVFVCDNSATCRQTSTSVRVDYAKGKIEGPLVVDTFSAPSLGEIREKSFVPIQAQENFLRDDYEGLLGVAYYELASSSGDKPPTFVDALVKQRRMHDSFGLLLCGTLQTLLQGGDTTTRHAGQWLLGGSIGPDGEKFFAGQLFPTPIVLKRWYVVVVSDVGFGDTSLGFKCSEYNSPRAIMDSGTTNMVLSMAVFNAFMAKLVPETMALIPNFDSNFFENPCCGTSYCDPTSSSSPLLRLPSISVTLAMQDESGTEKHFKVTIPPEYYFRPERNGNGVVCRVLGIVAGRSTVLGDVFMDGLYTYHDRVEDRIGVQVAENCPNQVVSSKTIELTTKSTDWCDCFSSDLKSDSFLTTFNPFNSGNQCFFMFWWMYLILFSILIILISLAVILYQYYRRRKQHGATGHKSDAALTAQDDQSPLQNSEFEQSSDEFEQMSSPIPFMEDQSQFQQSNSA